MKVVVQVGSGQVGTVLARALHDFELRNELETFHVFIQLQRRHDRYTTHLSNLNPVG